MTTNTDLTQADTAGNNAVSVDNICFNDIPVSDLLNSSAVELVQRFGGSYYADGEGRISYDEIEFCMLDDETVDYIISYNLENITVNGQSFKVSRDDITRDDIIGLFGSDYVEEDHWIEGGYSSIIYYYPQYKFIFNFDRYDGRWSIEISKYSGEDAGSTTSATTGETIESLLEDPVTKAQYEEAFASYEEQGMSVAVEAKGNDLVMSLTIQDAYLLTDETAVQLQRALDSDETVSTFSGLASSLDQSIGAEPGTCTYSVRYLDPDGNVLAERIFTAE